MILVNCGGGQDTTTGTEGEAVASGVLNKIKEEGKLRVGMAQTTPGAFIDVDTGEWTGIHVDVAKELAKFLDVELEIVETSWDLFLPALNSGEFDVYMPGTFYTGARALQAAYTDIFCNWLNNIYIEMMLNHRTLTNWTFHRNPASHIFH